MERKASPRRLVSRRVPHRFAFSRGTTDFHERWRFDRKEFNDTQVNDRRSQDGKTISRGPTNFYDPTRGALIAAFNPRWISITSRRSTTQNSIFLAVSISCAVNRGLLLPFDPSKYDIRYRQARSSAVPLSEALYIKSHCSVLL